MPTINQAAGRASATLSLVSSGAVASAAPCRYRCARCGRSPLSVDRRAGGTQPSEEGFLALRRWRLLELGFESGQGDRLLVGVQSIEARLSGENRANALVGETRSALHRPAETSPVLDLAGDRSTHHPTLAAGQVD